MSTSGEGDNLDGVAVIGMAGRFPRARNVDEFWRNLRDGVEAITFFSDDELAEAGISRSLLSRPDYVKALGVLETRSCSTTPSSVFNLRRPRS